MSVSMATSVGVAAVGVASDRPGIAMSGAALAAMLAIKLPNSRTAESEADEPAVLRERVTSPGGTTAAAFSVLEEADVRAIFGRAFEAARRRAGELADGAAD